MSRNFKPESNEGPIETHPSVGVYRITPREPQAPRSISIEEADKDSAIGRNNIPYGDGGEGHAGRAGSKLPVNR